MKVQGVTSDVILGDPLSRSGAVYFTNLAAEQIYSAIIDADGSEATLISIAPKSGEWPRIDLLFYYYLCYTQVSVQEPFWKNLRF